MITHHIVSDNYQIGVRGFFVRELLCYFVLFIIYSSNILFNGHLVLNNFGRKMEMVA